MKPTKKYTFTMAGNGVYRLQVSGDYFKILSASGLVRVKGKWGELSSLVAGQGLENSDFDDLFFTDESGASNTVTVFVGDRNFIDGLTGNVGISGTVNTTVANKDAMQGAYYQAGHTITSGNSAILAANSSRRYLMIQNNDATGIVYVNVIGNAASAASGIKILPGAVLEFANFCPTGVVSMIGSIGSNPNVIVLEG